MFPLKLKCILFFIYFVKLNQIQLPNPQKRHSTCKLLLTRAVRTSKRIRHHNLIISRYNSLFYFPIHKSTVISTDHTFACYQLL